MTNYSYDYLGILNEVCSTLNEVEVTDSEFDSLIGFHAHMKAKINSAIQDIYSAEDNEWPFALTETTQVVTVGFTGAVAGAIPDYSTPVDTASVDWDSFYIARDDALTDGSQVPLDKIDWDVYRKNYRYIDANSDTSEHSKPKFVTRKQNNKFNLTPLSDAAYTVKYEYLSKGSTLVLTTDAPLIPLAYKQVLIDRVMYYAYMFRDNVEEAALVKKEYEDGLYQMRRALIPQFDTLRFID